MGIVRTVLISTIDLTYPKSLCKNIFLKHFEKSKIPVFPLCFCVHSLVKVKVRFWEGRWPPIKMFIKWNLLSQIWNKIFHLYGHPYWGRARPQIALKISVCPDYRYEVESSQFWIKYSSGLFWMQKRGYGRGRWSSIT